ncbi:chromosome partitioning ATPase Soj-related protein [Syntrophotalea carbinolica DSM 2380]|uniref:Chromosome partitioning ATPase Soj-related protein n=1 Tax=Syntrophotalea carbinolica (strain DSM 2380 / NBRC 103641 / GraBd1) TaxID=338963 RepID=Q3A1P0_SYNC1|nr:AAA family ATPase [Syntrophotalea carbinolica]ABA89717.1 chromosome partitioning ATPase Soj-related protein [Syntrophotalea carbinolica DSM 2380]
MANIISIISSKGGAGKTTIALNLAVALAETGDSTLLIDVDPLGAVGFSLARNDTEWRGLAEHIVDETPLDEVIIQTKLPQLSILARGCLDPLDIDIYENVLRCSDALKDIVSAVENQFRHIIIDTPSGLGSVTRAALSVSTHTLLPLQAEPLALRSISQALHVIQHVKENENQDLELLGILAIMVQLNKDVSFTIMNAAWSSLHGVLETYIPRAEVFHVASEKGLPVAFLPGRYPPEAKRFEMLASEIKTLIQDMGGDMGVEDERPQRELI